MSRPPFYNCSIYLDVKICYCKIIFSHFRVISQVQPKAKQLSMQPGLSCLFVRLLSVCLCFSDSATLQPGVDFINCFMPCTKLFALYAQLLRSFLLAQKLGTRRESLVYSVKQFMKLTPVWFHLLDPDFNH